MTEDDLLETVKSEFAEVKLGAPVENVLARGQAIRRRRRLLPATGAGVGVAAVAAVVALGIGGSGGVTSSSATLTAWTVTTQPNHTVTLTIRDRHLSGPDRLHMRRALNAAGVPALVLTTRPVCVYRLTKLQPIPYRPFPRSTATTFRIRLSKIAKGARVVIVLPKYVPLLTRPIRVRPVRPARPLPRISVRQLTRVPTVIVVPPARACLIKRP